MESGFRLLGPDHLAALAAVAGAGAAALALTRWGGALGQRRTRVVLAVALAAAHLVETAVAAWQGWYERQMLPLQLCDFAAALAVCGLVTLDRRAVEPLCFFAFAGTLPALVTPELDVGLPAFRFVVYFLEHGLTVIAALVLVVGLRLRPSRGAWLRAVVLLNVLAGVAALANRALGTNFFYLSRKPVGPTPFDVFGPWPVYLFALEALVIAIFRLLQAPWPATPTKPA